MKHTRKSETASDNIHEKPILFRIRNPDTAGEKYLKVAGAAECEKGTISANTEGTFYIEYTKTKTENIEKMFCSLVENSYGQCEWHLNLILSLDKHRSRTARVTSCEK